MEIPRPVYAPLREQETPAITGSRAGANTAMDAIPPRWLLAGSWEICHRT